MRISDGKEAFREVIIVLESQEEVDELFAVFNYGYLATALERVDNGFACTLWRCLERRKTSGYSKFLDSIDAFLTKRSEVSQ